MKHFEITFPSLLILWEFRHLVKSRIKKTSLLRNTIYCSCTEDEILLAVHAFHAKVRPV